MASVSTPTVPTPPSRETAEDRFRRLAARWRAETAYCSSTTEMVENSTYQEIIRMGETAVPYLLRDLEKAPEHWSWALHSITGANPVPATDAGNLDKMADAWLAWGRASGYQW